MTRRALCFLALWCTAMTMVSWPVRSSAQEDNPRFVIVAGVGYEGAILPADRPSSDLRRQSEFLSQVPRATLRQHDEFMRAFIQELLPEMRAGPYGYTIEVYNALQATEVMMRATGKLAEPSTKHQHAHMTWAELVGLSFHPRLAELPVDDEPCTLPAAVVPRKEGE